MKLKNKVCQIWLMTINIQIIPTNTVTRTDIRNVHRYSYVTKKMLEKQKDLAMIILFVLYLLTPLLLWYHLSVLFSFWFCFLLTNLKQTKTEKKKAYLLQLGENLRQLRDKLQYIGCSGNVDAVLVLTHVALNPQSVPALHRYVDLQRSNTTLLHHFRKKIMIIKIGRNHKKINKKILIFFLFFFLLFL